MSYVTLDEVVKMVRSETGVDVTVHQLIRAAAHRAFPLCVLLNDECYSPIQKAAREAAAEAADPEYWTSSACEDAIASHGKPNATAYGLFALATRDVFAFQTKEAVQISSAWALDGSDHYFLYKTVTREELQVTLAHLKNFTSGIVKTDVDKVLALSTVENPAVRSGMKNVLKTKTTPLDPEIREAKARALDPENYSSVWAELSKLAYDNVGSLIGHSSDGIQYRGKKFQETEEPDVFTLKNLRDRMYREMKKR